MHLRKFIEACDVSKQNDTNDRKNLIKSYGNDKKFAKQVLFIWVAKDYFLFHLLFHLI